MNLYNDLVVDINVLHNNADYNSRKINKYRHNWLKAVTLFIVIKILMTLRVYTVLIDAGIIRAWFNQFKKYWEQELKGLTIFIHDFHYLRCSYRSRFTSVEVLEGATENQFNNAWQRPENIYSTFAAVYNQAMNPIIARGYRKYIKRKQKILEYGCGIAPITTSLIKYLSYLDNEYVIADIKGFPFHYAKYALLKYGVKTYNIEPYKPVIFNEKFDVIFLMTVLEHLPDPDVVVESLIGALNPGGVIIFDYIKSDGHGLDTVESCKKRGTVLRSIEDKCSIIRGRVDLNNSMGLTVAIKK